MKIFLVVQQIFLFTIVHCSHYKGGTVTWKPTDPTSNSSNVEIQITLRHSWTLARYHCDQNLINSQGIYYDTNGATAYPTLVCQSSTSACSASQFSTINHITLCTDYNTIVQISSGSYSEKQTLSSSTNIDIAWAGGNWADEIYPIGGSPPGGLGWYVGTHIDLTLPIYPINSSPGSFVFDHFREVASLFSVTGSLPIIRVIENQVAIIQIPAADWDTGQTLRCRFASNTAGYGSECSGVCGGLPNANISATSVTHTLKIDSLCLFLV